VLSFLLRLPTNFKGSGVNHATLMAHATLKEKLPISNPFSPLSMVILVGDPQSGKAVADDATD